ncbi:fasciclin domain-containing protein [Arenibacter sp. GZD96]|uniref:fasciclin domain-containing protein n=1 Tax=Aurantibrevibacter litoralis TaxID=3106030 RepID=UPI002AFDFAFE|nr:fasciclin domain-containing protein [Arenibacter sp. GZD-96]MEA1784978.1 fasciclin domain-containing protein [Arenibacter sp. GZD-96]
MKKIIKNGTLIFAMILSLFLISCSSDDNDPAPPTTPPFTTPPPTPEPPAETGSNIVELASATDDLSSLVAALVQADAGLVEVLEGDGPFTVFAPTNAAFIALLDALGDDFNSLEDFDTAEEKQLLADVLTYHVVSGAAALSTSLTDGQEIGTVQGENVTVSLTGGVFIQDATETDAAVTAPDEEATNGVVHIIDKVLLPQAVLDALAPPAQANIVETAQSVDDLSALVAALIQADAGLVEVLSGEGPFTVFAPTNDAFTALLDVLGDDFNSLADFDTAAEKELLAKVLTYHVVSGVAALSTSLTDGQEIPTVQGENVTVNLTGGVFIGDATEVDAQVIQADVETSNGVVHVINKVLVPQEVLDLLAPPATQNIVETAQSVPALSLLVDALIQADAGLVEVLSGDGPFTVFAPTNEAFAALLDELGPSFTSLADFDTAAEKELLAKVLTYHVVSGAGALSSSLTDGQEFATVQGENVTVNLTGGVFIGDATEVDAQVIQADVETSNGVVHVVNKVLLPQEVLDAL